MVAWKAGPHDASARQRPQARTLASGGGGQRSPPAASASGASRLVCRRAMKTVAARAAMRASAGQRATTWPAKGSNMAAGLPGRRATARGGEERCRQPSCKHPQRRNELLPGPAEICGGQMPPSTLPSSGLPSRPAPAHCQSNRCVNNFVAIQKRYQIIEVQLLLHGTCH